MYSIIIPVYNEVSVLPELLEKLTPFYTEGHEIIIIDDGSTDDSQSILSRNNKYKILFSEQNLGKGYSIIKGLKHANFKKIIIFDGDLELDPSDISKLMILGKNYITCVLGYRNVLFFPPKSILDLGNFLFTKFFNFLNKCNHKDILCCAKAFYRFELNNKQLKSNGFDIDVEIASLLSETKGRIIQIPIEYKRRSINEGKKLKISDGWKILKTMIKLNFKQFLI